MRVLITDSLSPVAIELLSESGFAADVQLKKSEEELGALAAGADGWIIRSGTQITESLIAASDKLKVIGRAGVGVDNIDLEAATRKGVLVVNAPDGNTISTAEHTCAMILAMVRQIPRAAASLAGGAWQRKEFAGSELGGKTLGIVGVGKIGGAVAARMQSFGMRIIGFDPVLAAESAERLGIELVSLDQIWAQSDVISFHTPLNDATRGLLNARTLAACKDGVRVANIARGGIVDERALLEALRDGKVGGAALDVYSQEPPPAELAELLANPLVVATPHIAASTDEAQEKVAVQIVDQVIRALRGEPVSTPVNAARLHFGGSPEVAPYMLLAERLGCLGAQLVDRPLKKVTVELSGELVVHHADLLTLSALVGLMKLWSDVPVNLVNATVLSAEKGLDIEEIRRAEGRDFSNEIGLILKTAKGERTIRGSIVGQGACRLVGFDDYPIEVSLEGHLLFYENVDRPGMLAAVGAALARADVNIAGLSLGREAPGAMALTVLGTDEPISDELLSEISQIKGIREVLVGSV